MNGAPNAHITVAHGAAPARFAALIGRADAAIPKPSFDLDFERMSERETIAEAVANIVAEFGLFDDWLDRYEYIIELGRKLPGLPPERRAETARVKGCQSQVWFHAREQGGRVFFEADSDAMIVRGLIALLLRVYSGRRPEEILATPPDFFEKIELGSHLTGNRANGLHAMVKHIQGYARSFQATAPAP